MKLSDRVLKYIRAHGLAQAGERVVVAVSGGADSVALFRLLLELRAELGLVLSVAHFHHRIRGAEADADQQFVIQLAQEHGLGDCVHLGQGNAPGHAHEAGQSLESAARELRHGFFRKLLSDGHAQRIATAHTLDDQAETVLLRLMRGAGTRGLAGIYPEKADAGIIRPMLAVSRSEIESYLCGLMQTWREDLSNADLRHSRNRIRHELLPLLRRDFNPAIAEVLARTAEIARGEEEYWTAETARLLPLVMLAGKPVRGGGRGQTAETGFALSLEPLGKQPRALQRRLVRAAALLAGMELDQEHVEYVLRLAGAGPGKSCELPGGWQVRRSFRELCFESRPAASVPLADYSYPLEVPGAVSVPEINSVVRARLLPMSGEAASYNPEVLELDRLVLRNWRSGDRYRPAHSGGEKKVKELLQAMKVPLQERRVWPVAEAAGRLVWVQGTRPRTVLVRRGSAISQLVIETEP